MKAENCFFELLPKVVPADKETVVKIRPLFDHVCFNSDRQYQITCYPVEEIALQSGWPKQNRQNLTVLDDCLCLSKYFEGEQEHVLLVVQLEPFTGGVLVLLPGLWRVVTGRGDCSCCWGVGAARLD